MTFDGATFVLAGCIFVAKVDFKPKTKLLDHVMLSSSKSAIRSDETCSTSIFFLLNSRVSSKSTWHQTYLQGYFSLVFPRGGMHIPWDIDWRHSTARLYLIVPGGVHRSGAVCLLLLRLRGEGLPAVRQCGQNLCLPSWTGLTFIWRLSNFSQLNYAFLKKKPNKKITKHTRLFLIDPFTTCISICYFD